MVATELAPLAIPTTPKIDAAAMNPAMNVK
jgi:hypothetical protein